MPAPRTLAAASAAATLILAATASATPITTWDYGFSQLQHGVYDDKGNPQVQDYANVFPSVDASPLDNGIKLFTPGDGTPTFALTGADYIGTPPDPSRGGGTVLRGNRFTNYGGGTINGAAWQHPDDLIRTTFNFGFDFSGGALDIYRVQTFFFLSNSEGGFVAGVGSSTGFDPFEPGGYGLGFAFEDRFGSDISTASTVFWGVEIYYDWTNQGPDDTLNFYLGSNSIDITAVPAPGTASILALAGLISARRRRGA